jgi:hypothetical protein
VLRSVHLSEKVARSGLLDRSFDAGQCAGVLPMQVLHAVPFAIGRRLQGMAGRDAVSAAPAYVASRCTGGEC